MSYTASRAKPPVNKTRHKPYSDEEIEALKRNKDQRRVDAVFWKKDTDEFIDDVLRYKTLGGKDTILNEKIKNYLEGELGVDYNKNIIKGEKENLGRHWWMKNAVRTQKANRKTFADLVRDKTRDKPEDEEDKKERGLVCFANTRVRF